MLRNGAPVFMNGLLCDGDTLTIRILETESSEKIPPVQLPLSILYEDEDLLVINKPAGMPIHPPWEIMKILWQMPLPGTISRKTVPLSFAV